jgi:hypothetical protein
MVAFWPSVTFREEGMEMPVMQKVPRPVWEMGDLRMVLKLVPLLPRAITTSMLDSSWLELC